jgi:hypothetical protein
MQKTKCCCWCGDYLEGAEQYYDRYDTCGKPACDRHAREMMREDRDSAMEEYRGNQGWND